MVRLILCVGKDYGYGENTSRFYGVLGALTYGRGERPTIESHPVFSIRAWFPTKGGCDTRWTPCRLSSATAACTSHWIGIGIRNILLYWCSVDRWWWWWRRWRWILLNYQRRGLNLGLTVHLHEPLDLGVGILGKYPVFLDGLVASRLGKILLGIGEFFGVGFERLGILVQRLF